MQLWNVSRTFLKGGSELDSVSLEVFTVRDTFRREATPTRLREDSAKGWAMQRFGFESQGKLGQPRAIALILQRNPKAGIAYRDCSSRREFTKRSCLIYFHKS